MEPPLAELVGRIVGSFHALKAASTTLYGDGEHSASRRGIVRSLRAGARTVPQLARERPVSRQFVQQLVDELLADGLVERLPNPEHARSHLIGLTPPGRTMADEMVEVEGALWRRWSDRFDPDDVGRAVRVLEQLRTLLLTEVTP